MYIKLVPCPEVCNMSQYKSISNGHVERIKIFGCVRSFEARKYANGFGATKDFAWVPLGEPKDSNILKW